MPHFASRLGSTALALVVTVGVALSATPLDAAAAGTRSHTVLRCSVRHHVRHCVRVVLRRAAVRHTVKPVARHSRPASNTPAKPATASGGLVAQELALVNADRAGAHLAALHESAQLDRIATARAQDMVTNRYFGHYRPGDHTLAVLELLRANHVSFSWHGENIIWESGQPAGSLAGYFNTWWMNSPEHRANILSSHYGHIGIGVVVSGSRVYMVEDFTN